VLLLDNITRGLEELDVFDNNGIALVRELDNITGGIGEFHVFDKIGFI
jgi:hypothetical protein